MSSVVLDLETEKDFKEVGGKHNLHLLGVTVVGVYDYATDVYRAYEKEEFKELEELLKRSSCVVGFNSIYFDLPVLAPHVSFDVGTINSLDLMEGIEKSLGFRVSLDNLSRATLGAGKSGYGLEAIEWWRNGEKDKVKEYCLKDVQLTRELYEFGKQRGFVVGDTRDRGRVKIPVEWNTTTTSLKKILHDALNRRVAVEIDYGEEMGSLAHTKQKIDIYSIHQNSFEGFCHSRRSKRIFQLDHIENAVLTEEKYQLHEDVQSSLI